VLATVAGSTLLVLMTFTSVNSTLTAMTADIGGGAGWETWALGGIGLGLAATLLTAGSLADLFGHRRMFVAANLALAGTGALAAAAPTIGVFVVARVLQGVAAGGVLASGLGLLGRHFAPGPPRTRATGIWAAGLGAGITLGPIVSAVLADAIDWRAAWVLVAAGAVVAASAGRSLDPAPPIDDRRRLDVRGAAVMAVAMGCLVGGITAGRTDWTSGETLLLIVVGLESLLLFIWIEYTHRDPMLDLAHFRNPAFLATVGGAAVTGLTTIALLSYMPVMLGRSLGLAAVATGAVPAIWSATGMAVSGAAGRLPAGFGAPARLAAGLLLSAAGLAGMAVLGAGTHWWAFAPGLFVAGLGSGLANAAVARLAVEAVPPAQAGLGSGASNTARYLGAAMGIAVVVAIVTSGDDPSAGWNRAAVVTGALNVVGAALILAPYRFGRATPAQPSR
jgi:MFS family permease